MGKKNKNKMGFMLVELLATILILTIVLIIAVPTASNLIEDSKDKAFFLSVSNIVNSLQPSVTLSEKEYCLYDYSKDSKNHTDDIRSLYVLITKTEGKHIYSVFAKRKSDEIGIDIKDFSRLSVDDSSEWVQTPDLNNITNSESLELNSATEIMIEKLETDGIPSVCVFSEEAK